MEPKKWTVEEAQYAIDVLDAFLNAPFLFTEEIIGESDRLPRSALGEILVGAHSDWNGDLEALLSCHAKHLTVQECCSYMAVNHGWVADR